MRAQGPGPRARPWRPRPADRRRRLPQPDQLSPADRHHNPCARDDPVAQSLGNAVGVGGGERERKSDEGKRDRSSPPDAESRAGGKRDLAPVDRAPTKGSSASSAAPSRSTMSTRGVKWAAAVMASEVSIMQPTITIRLWARATAIMRSASRRLPHLASLMLIPSTLPTRGGIRRR